jgi:hypothetical protein
VKGGALASSKDDEMGAVCAAHGVLGRWAMGASCGVAVVWRVKALKAAERSSR